MIALVKIIFADFCYGNVFVYHSGANPTTQPEGSSTHLESKGIFEMNHEIEKYNALQTELGRYICNILTDEINKVLPIAEAKIWHGSPVWFIEGNPIVGYSKLKSCIQLLFWSGASFEEGLTPVGKFKAAEVRYTNIQQINTDDLTRWLNKSKDIQWDYKNIVKHKGVLEQLK